MTVIEELAARVAKTRSTSAAYARFRSALGPNQIAVVDDRSPQIAAIGGRRCGKSTTALAKWVELIDRKPNCRAGYFAPSQDQAKGIVWSTFSDANHRYGLRLEPHLSDLRWSRGAATMQLFGYHTERQAEAARGRWFDILFVDEAQMGQSWFGDFLRKVLLPTLHDYNGQLVLMGTAGPVCAGFFHDSCLAPDGWSSRHMGTCADNPHFKGRDPLAEAREKYNLTEDDPIYQQEWLARWVVDPDALVYVILDRAIKTASPAQRWHGHVFGLDFGFKDRDALSVVSIDEYRQTTHLREVIEMPGNQTNHQLFDRIMALHKIYPGAPVVFDPAGHTTNKTIETFRQDAPRISWIAAEKTRKVEFIRLLNNDLRAGLTTVETGCQMIAKARGLRWKRPGVVGADAGHTDMGDAWLYAWRRARDLLRALPDKRVPADPFDEFLANQPPDPEPDFNRFARGRYQ